MTAQGWREVILHAFDLAINAHDQSALDDLAQQLAEEDEAKQILRDHGWGHTGLSLLKTIKSLVVHQGGDWYHDAKHGEDVSRET